MLLTSCHKQDGINVFQSVDTDGWDTKDTMVFEVPTTDYNATHNLTLLARITRQFAYKDLWMVVEQDYETDSLYLAQCDTIYPDEKEYDKKTTRTSPCSLLDTVHIEITNDNGIFEGSGKDLLEYEIPVRNVHLKQGTKGTIRIHHIMTDRKVEGIHDIGCDLSEE
ncbi:MAG: gliding motility lipoprotein GldH [Bacteroidaceae bacterium]|nr:gliding motility lipoprotein GldH [Bacteroidaceae bacterium]